MQLYKSRGFGEYFGDTFSFLKLNGKHFFKHYFIISGVFLLILMVFGYFFVQFYSDLLSASLGGSFNNDNATAFEDYMNENGVLVGLFIFLFFTVGLIAAIISYAYVPIYLKLYERASNTNFSTSELVSEYKTQFGKLIIFLLAGLLLGILLIIPIAISAFILTITIIGIFLLPLLVGLILLLYTGTLIEYLKGKKGFFDCFGYSWTLVTSKFWAAVGCVGIFYIMGYIVQQIVTFIPYIFGMATMFTTIEDSKPEPENIINGMTIIMIVVFALSFLVGVFVNNIIQLNQGIVFYSLKEEKENINTKSDIDLIGSGE